MSVLKTEANVFAAT